MGRSKFIGRLKVRSHKKIPVAGCECWRCMPQNFHKFGRIENPRCWLCLEVLPCECACQTNEEHKEKLKWKSSGFCLFWPCKSLNQNGPIWFYDAMGKIVIGLANGDLWRPRKLLMVVKSKFRPVVSRKNPIKFVRHVHNILIFLISQHENKSLFLSDFLIRMWDL